MPAEPSISYLHGSKIRALAMIWVLVGVGVLAAIQILEPRSARHRWSGAVPAAVLTRSAAVGAGRRQLQDVACHG